MALRHSVAMLDLGQTLSVFVIDRFSIMVFNYPPGVAHSVSDSIQTDSGRCRFSAIKAASKYCLSRRLSRLMRASS
jgi:hypothetical protein